MCIEVNRGDVAQVELRQRYGYSNFFVWKHHDAINNVITNKLGWYTSLDTRPKLVSRAIHVIKEKKWRLNSPWFLKELARFEFDPVKQRMAGAIHDDRVMAGFIALYCSKDWDFQEDITATIEQRAEEPVEYQCLAVPAYEEYDREYYGESGESLCQ